MNAAAAASCDEQLVTAKAQRKHDDGRNTHIYLRAEKNMNKNKNAQRK